MSDKRTNYEHDPIDITEFEEVDYTPVEYDASPPEVTSSGVENDTKEDYENARKTYYELIEKGQGALNNLLEIAAQTEHPRSYEVVSQLLKTVSDTNDRLIELQNQMRKIAEMDRDLSGEAEGKNGSVTNNTIFVGSMNDFQQYIKKMRKGELQPQPDTTKDDE